MARRKAEPGQIAVAASYRDPRAVPLRDAAKLLDLDYSMIFDDVDRHELMTGHFKSGRYRIVGYEKPRKPSDEPALVEVRFVKAAFEAVLRDEVFDPVHDRLLIRPRGFREPTGQWRGIPGQMEEWREMQRLMALPSAIDWTGCTLRAGRYGFINCKAIRAADLSIVDLVSEVAEGPEATQAEELPHDLPPPTEGRLREVLEAIFIENQAWEGAGAPKLLPAVRRRDPLFNDWSDSYLKKKIKKVKGDALRNARLARKTASGG